MIFRNIKMLSPNSSSSHNPVPYSLLFFSFILIVFSYSNSLQASWHFDDEQNILKNSKIHLTELSLDKIAEAVTDPSEPSIYRPLPMFTFALNWYFGQDNVYSYHLFNIMIHILTAYALFSVIRLLFFCCYAERYSRSFINMTALMAALLWALAPIQTQAVTYIVQRMASMAAMFTIFAIYAYLRARAEKTQKKYCWFLFCLMFYFAALGSKSNSILLPVSLLLLEFSFFDAIKTKIAAFRIILPSSVVLIIAFLFVYYGLSLNPLKLEGYADRPFTLTERLLTEPRIVIMYLSQLILPITDRLSLEHDVILSTSLLSPWTTLPALFFIFFVIAVSIRYIKKYPIISFPILFFFLNHLVESTFIPLELVFEHRNYLPSLFFFLPVGFLFAKALYGETRFSPVGRVAIMLCGALYLTTSGYATFTRNLAWATEKSLLNDSLKKAPYNARAAYNLGKLSAQTGDHNKAYYLFQFALEHAEKSPAPKFMKRLALHGLALNRKEFGQYKQAQQYIDQCLSIDKEYNPCREARVTLYLHQKLYKDALSEAKALADAYPAYKYLANTAVAANYANEMETFFVYIQKIIRFSLNNHQVMHLTGLGLMKVGSYQNSVFFLQIAHKLSPNMVEYQLALAAGYYLNNNEKKAGSILDIMFEKYPILSIQKGVYNIEQYGMDQTAVDYIVDTFSAKIKAAFSLLDE
ncbi:MAG: tetratricopeptide repeat protein [Candidatus Electrothrix gigas]